MGASRQQIAIATPVGDQPTKSKSRGFFCFGLAQRLALFVLVFGVEWASISNLVHKGLGAGSLLQLAIVVGSLFLALGYAKAKSTFQRVSSELEKTPIRWSLFAGHFLPLAGFVGLSFLPPASDQSGVQTAALAIAWFVAGALAIALAGSAFIPPRAAFELVRGTGYVWVYALLVGIVASKLVVSFPLWNGAFWMPATSLAWKPATDLTFGLVKAFLHLFLSDVVADRATMTIGSPTFNVTILPWCAGFEGTGLMLVFSVAWLLFLRREFRFPQAFLLIPVAMSVIWVSNAVRITALILIGVAGAPGVAEGGFHSQAGWIAFNCVALGFVVIAQRLPWVTRGTQSGARDDTPSRNPTAAYLMPFIVILAAAMFSRAASGGFEWLYPLRFVGAAAALWIYRSSYRDLNWKFGWYSPAAGALAFVMWIALDRFTGAHTDNGIASGLAALPASMRIAWLVLRTAAATITVPIAEELAFRGFLIRRLISADFERLRLQEFTYLSVAVSSVAFGVMHGDRWLAGTVVGVLYAATMLRRGRIGDAVVAHATTNALLAAWVLVGGHWNLW
jgi:exosortase E/protease (VPEID-CTERM system)